MVVLFQNNALLVATIEAHLFEPVRQRTEDAQLLRREHVPGLYQSSHDRVVGLADLEPQIAIRVDQQLTVRTACLLCSGIDYARYPLTATIDRGDVYGRVRLAAIVFVVR